MKVHELITALQKMDGDLEVYAYCDHGQTPEKVCSPSEIFTGSLDHALYDGYSGYEEDAEEEGHTFKAVLL